ncbi:hypothetical protein LTR20_007498 [Exophiala xenobiotica]|nr:hypothetical protein LTR40_009820 [Exophiala xenobiotica]KAK5367111.1 hypothetical protein LTS13_007964 [Exophiala xenobiotica]KAK5401361.1 hypothetical protein LTR79_001880 [Exophiala xenobiotica]KAK5406996.1 hypothetical protein LTR90_010253 [Exophiala xenobiotica]KAK5460191.1 hypothetical protein LTR20_007498 [Exophiala xenobiotica]
MSSSGSSTALIRRSSSQDVAAMPPPPFKRIKRPPKVLDEDEYTSALSDIIARDYFPGLLESQAQHEYLAALESGNDFWIAEAAHKLRDAAIPASHNGRRRTARNTRFNSTPVQNQNVADTPLGFTGSETPSGTSVAGSTFEDDSKAINTSTLSLSAFQSKYTSEDNESFNALLDKQNIKRRQKHAHLWTQDQRIPSSRLIEYRTREAEARLLTQDAQTSSSSTGGKELVPMHTGATDSRPARPDAWKIKRPDNTFMFNAASVDEDGLQTVQEAKEKESKAGPKHVVLSNTRFPAMQYVDDPGPVPPSPSLNTEIITKRGRLASMMSSADTDTNAGLSEADYAGGETPRVNGYAFVDEDEPGNTGPEINAAQPTYRDLLAGQVGDATPNPFRITDVRKREDLHFRMLEKQAKRKREKDRQTVRPLGGDNAGSTPAGNMTPAARRLMEKLGGRTPTRGHESGAAAREMRMWAPTPARTPRRRDLKR